MTCGHGTTQHQDRSRSQSWTYRIIFQTEGELVPALETEPISSTYDVDAICEAGAFEGKHK